MRSAYKHPTTIKEKRINAKKNIYGTLRYHEQREILHKGVPELSLIFILYYVLYIHRYSTIAL